MKPRAILALLSGTLAASLPLSAEDKPNPPRRFFSDDSFWNQPIAPNAEIDPRTGQWVKLLETEPSKENWLINCEQWTIPV